MLPPPYSGGVDTPDQLVDQNRVVNGRGVGLPVRKLGQVHGRTEFWDTIRDERVMSVPGATCRVRIWIESGDYMISDRIRQKINTMVAMT